MTANLTPVDVAGTGALIGGGLAASVSFTRLGGLDASRDSGGLPATSLSRVVGETG